MPLGRERQQIVVVEAEQRRLEHAGERQVVLRQAEEIAERHQVLHGDLLGQHQAVGARDLDAARLEGGDHGGRERRALAHQYEDVAGADGPVLGRQHLRRTRASRGWSGRCAPPAAPPARTRLASASGDQGSAGLTCSAFSVGQISISPAWPARWATCRIGVAEEVTPGVRARSAKTPSTAASSGSTARNDKFSGTRRSSRPASEALLRERIAHAGEHGGRRTLEAVDRLLLVADGEQRAHLLARAAAGEELLGQRADHVPLHRARVLRLVDQDVVEAAVELVEHPLHRLGGGEKAGGLADQVLEVERGAARLGGRVAVEHVAAEPQQRHRRLDDHQPLVLAVQGDEPRLRALRELDEIATGVRHLLRGEVACAVPCPG